MTRWHKLFYALIAILVGGFVGFAIDDLGNRVNSAETAASTRDQAVDRLARQVERLGGEPVVEPSDLEEPVDLPAELTPAQIQDAVTAYCSTGLCKGNDGAPGVSVTPPQVAAAVASYCTRNGECRGPAGREGTDGATGDPGTQGEAGPTGPPPSDAQVAEAVANYCASHDQCRGPQGPEGPRGDDGRGISALSCESLTPLELTVTYTDGTSETFTCGGIE